MVLGWWLVVPVGFAQSASGDAKTPGVLNLSTSKQMLLPVPGEPRKLNSLPMSLAVSPDGRWVVSLNAGYGTLPSRYMESLGVLNTATGETRDFPEERTLVNAPQTLYQGLAFSADGRHLYASMASSTDPEGVGKGATGNGIVVYSFREGEVKAERFIHLPMVALAAGRRTDLVPKVLPIASPRQAAASANQASAAVASPFPAGLTVVSGSPERLLVAENLSDTVALVDGATGKLEHRFDLGSGTVTPSTYPIAVVVSRDGRRAFVALWNASEVVELDLVRRAVVRRVALMKPSSPTAAGSHPCALLLDERKRMLYVALANRDAVAAVNVGTAGKPQLTVAAFFDTRLPGQSYFGAEPDALAENADGSRVYAANMGSDAVAVLDTSAVARKQRSLVEPIGFVPTELMPTALASVDGSLYVATAKGKGTGPNTSPQVVTPQVQHMPAFHRPFTYVGTLLFGSVAKVEEREIEQRLKAWTQETVASNRMKAEEETLPFAAGRNPIRHVIYIFRENRTYDQVLGDLTVGGQRVGNGDPSMTMYGAAITPNQHKLALQFGVIDNFYDSAEVSGDGHVWSMAAIGSDYLERTWQANYRGSQRTYDFEGMVADGYPLYQKIPDVNEPASGYLWTDLAAHGKSLLHFGEYVSSVFCTDKVIPSVDSNPQQGAMSGSEQACPTPAIAPGQAIPEEWGGGTNRYAWSIPRLARNIATKPELVGHFVPETPDFNLHIPDQIRVNVFLRHLEQWKRERAAGHDTMPAFVLLRLPNDHTGGTTPGGPTPKASIADNDLAIGRAVEAVSHSAYWDDTAIFMVEDDAQNGGDHVDSHRSIAFVISKYSPHAPAGKPAFVDSRFYTTVSMIRTMEMVLGVPPMNNNDAFSSAMGSLVSGPGDQPPFTADVSNRENGLIYTANGLHPPGGVQSAHMDFRRPDQADAATLNVILWRDAMGDKPVPAMLRAKHGKRRDDD